MTGWSTCSSLTFPTFTLGKTLGVVWPPGVLALSVTDFATAPIPPTAKSAERVTATLRKFLLESVPASGVSGGAFSLLSSLKSRDLLLLRRRSDYGSDSKSNYQDADGYGRCKWQRDPTR